MAKWISFLAFRIFFLVIPGLHTSAFGSEAKPASADPVLEAKVMQIASELRCLVCQNQTIADSHAGLAVDLRNQVREMLQQGKTEAEITAYMTARYGDFVLYRPPLKPTTYILWIAPAIMVLGGLTALIWVLRRRNQLPEDAFDPESPEAPEAASTSAKK